MKSIQVVLRKHEFPEHNNVNLRIPFLLPKNLKVSFKIRLSLSNNIIIARFISKHYIMSSIYTKTYTDIFPQSMLTDVMINT